jgi:hypothetical protein
MEIGEPPSEPLLARRATTARSSISSGAGEPDPLVGGTVRNCCCGVTVLTRDPKILGSSRERPHWLTYMASLFRCQEAAARHTPATGREPHVGPVRRTHSAAPPLPARASRAVLVGQVTEARP